MILLKTEVSFLKRFLINKKYRRVKMTTRKELVEDCLNKKFFEINFMTSPIRHGFMVIDPANPETNKQEEMIKDIDLKLSVSVYTGFIVTVTGSGTDSYNPGTTHGQSKIENEISRYKNHLQNIGAFYCNIVDLSGFKVLFVHT
ncbi:hypothetical protein KJ603_01585 [Patescibacteria group bacterium]|nr:hypothetical protein [Patescibacteria group bacterium]